MDFSRGQIGAPEAGAGIPEAGAGIPHHRPGPPACLLDCLQKAGFGGLSMSSSPRWVWAPAQTLDKRQVPNTWLGPWPTPSTCSPDRTPEILQEWTSGKKGLSQQDYRHTP